MNTEYTEHDPAIAPDESFVVFSSFKPGGSGIDDLYVSFHKKNGGWTKLINLGPEINSSTEENRPVISQDGKYLFYMSSRYGSNDYFWVDINAVTDLKP